MLHCEKIEFKLKHEFGLPGMESNLIDNDLDLLELVGSDAGSKRIIDSVIRHVEHGRTWSSNASKIEADGSYTIIKPAFDWDACCRVKRKDLLTVLRKYRDFVFEN